MSRFSRHLVMALGVMAALTFGFRAADQALCLIGVCGWQNVTDPRHGRSGLGLGRDAGTGCEYLLSPYGGITPRLGPDGRAICR